MKRADADHVTRGQTGKSAPTVPTVLQGQSKKITSRDHLSNSNRQHPTDAEARASRLRQRVTAAATAGTRKGDTNTGTRLGTQLPLPVTFTPRPLVSGTIGLEYMDRTPVTPLNWRPNSKRSNKTSSSQAKATNATSPADNVKKLPATETSKPTTATTIAAPSMSHSTNQSQASKAVTSPESPVTLDVTRAQLPAADPDLVPPVTILQPSSTRDHKAYLPPILHLPDSDAPASITSHTSRLGSALHHVSFPARLQTENEMTVRASSKLPGPPTHGGKGAEVEGRSSALPLPQASVHSQLSFRSAHSQISQHARTRRGRVRLGDLQKSLLALSEEDERAIRRSLTSDLRLRQRIGIHTLPSFHGGDTIENVMLAHATTTPELLHLIRQLPVNMEVKRKVRMILADKLTTDQTHWQKIRESIGIVQRLLWIAFQDVRDRVDIWRRSIVTIRGRYGMGVAAYFSFLQWLILLNVYMSIIFAFFIYLPNVAYNPATADVNRTATCSARYDNYMPARGIGAVTEFFDGTGWVEHSVLFYGHYSDKCGSGGDDFDPVSGSRSRTCVFPLLYLTGTLLAFATSFILMIVETSMEVRHRQFHVHGQHGQNCNTVFAGWDFSITQAKSAATKHECFVLAVQEVQADEREKEIRANQTRGQKSRLLLTRVGINLLVITVLIIAGYIIFLTAQYSIAFKSMSQASTYEDNNSTLAMTHSQGLTLSVSGVQSLLMRYLPSIAITILNFTLPLAFTHLAQLEKQSPDNQVSITIYRSVFLRLASIIVFLGTIYYQMICSHKDDCDVGIPPQCNAFNCWESYVGQNLYMLIVTRFFAIVVLIFCYDFPYRWVVHKFWHIKLVQMLDYNVFDIPIGIIDLIYQQTIGWLSLLFSPLSPIIMTLSFFCQFYLWKLTVMRNYVPAKRPYRASSSRALFYVVLLTSFVLSCFPIGYVIFGLRPSVGCGPFRALTRIWDVVLMALGNSPSGAQQLFGVITSSAFVLPLLVFLSISVYFMSSLVFTQKEIVGMLHDQVIMAGREKRLLMAELDTARMRLADQFQSKSESVLTSDSVVITGK